MCIRDRAYVARFNFSGADQEKKCGMLSGGERNRLHLALALKEEDVYKRQEGGIGRGRPAGERAAAQKSSRMAEDCGIFTIFAG